jgi:hypothetical protein
MLIFERVGRHGARPGGRAAHRRWQPATAESRQGGGGNEEKVYGVEGCRGKRGCRKSQTGAGGAASQLLPPSPPGRLPVGGWAGLEESSTTDVAGSQPACWPPPLPPPDMRSVFPAKLAGRPPLIYLNRQLKCHSNCYERVGRHGARLGGRAAHRRWQPATAESRQGGGGMRKRYME